jgi:Uma2 family endonuclease
MDDLDILSRYPVTRHRLSVADYHRLADAGILGEDDRVELLEGQLIAMSPVGTRHALAIDALTDLLSHALIPPARLRVHNPVVLDHGSEPQPDIAVVRRPWRGYPGEHPGAEDTLLLVEVADSSLAFDQGAKRTLYARAGIREFWIVDLTTDVVHVHRGPIGDSYTVIERLAADATLTIDALPNVTIPAGPLFT